MSQLEPMMAEEKNYANSYDGHDGVFTNCVCVGENNND
jgi:hypothetical protein